MDQIKQAVPLRGRNGPAIVRVIGALLFGPAVCTGIYLGIQKWLAFCDYPAATIEKVQKIWEMAGIPITALLIAIYLFRTLRRRYAYAYMKDYYAQLAANGCRTCPRCGSSVSERTGTKYYQAHVGDKITTTRYSSGAVTVSKQPIFATRTRSYTYHMCDNSACAIDDDRPLRYGRMPYSRGDLRAVILCDPSGSKHCAGYLVCAGKHAMRTLLTVVAIAAIAAAMLYTKFGTGRIYGQFGGRDTENISTAAELGTEEKAYIAEARKRIESADGHRLHVKEQKTGLFKNEKSAEIYAFSDSDGKRCLQIRLDGLKTTTGLTGLFYLMPYQGKTSVFCNDDKTIYPPDSAFYNEHYDALAAWDGAAYMLALLDRIRTGDLSENGSGSPVLRSEKISLYLPDEGSVRILDEKGDVPLRCIFSASDKNKRPSDYAEYRLFGEQDTETDPLQKLLNTAGYEAKIRFFKDDEEIAEIRCADNGDGSHTFRFEEDYLSFTKAKYVIYPAESRFEVYAYDPDRYTYADTPQKLTAAANKEQYDWLAAMIPDTYVRANFRLDSAKKGKMLWVTTYTDTGDGGKKAVLMIGGGKVGKFECYQTEKDYTQITW